MMAMRHCDGAVFAKIMVMDLDVIIILIGSEILPARRHLSYGIRQVSPDGHLMDRVQ
jgi:hypothetical protein